jgi:hypothetical protein
MKTRQKNEIKIADVRLGYRNREMILLLKERGKLIADDADKVPIVTVDKK